MRVGIMGFGRIGRNIFRILTGNEEIEVVAIVDLAEFAGLEYLLRFDTVHGRFPEEVRVVDDYMYVLGRQIRMLHARAPGDVDWQGLGVDVVVESTGKYRRREQLQRHLDSGASHVILTSPPKAGEQLDALVVSGVNDDAVGAQSRIISAASCTINAIAPVLQVIEQNFGIEHAFMTSVHAYTNDQRLADVPHADLRRSRAAAENIIPTATYSPAGIGEVLPAMAGKLTGMALNVPIPDGSTVDLTCRMTRSVDRDQINEVVRSAAASTHRSIIAYSEDPIVSSDVIGDPHSAIFDSLATMVLDGDLVKVLVWYDNGWGYATRVVELIQRIGKTAVGGAA
ncbi:type I glyceraldehyde-3-phosphate dehydrogenase [bacterium]|nr:MAG: type I glyceraldehyde-3-phosphate dehydrogenase [bacterium]RKZ17378.1 MAG: type I glyceraldehyde-3-phosphate dehydrogenase [bacterium]